MNEWKTCKRILIIRADNMGDVLMTTPALRALKGCLQAELTLLTSSQGKPICDCIPEIDSVIVADLPWVKLNVKYSQEQYTQLVTQLRALQFDAAIIFTVYSQSSLPAALLTFQAGIPLRLAYARENPYSLLTEWIPDKEPYTTIKHQVERDLDLVALIGATTNDTRLSMQLNAEAVNSSAQKLFFAGIYLPEPYLVFHAGVSEAKREYPAGLWIETIRQVSKNSGKSILLTGSESEKGRINMLMRDLLPEVYNVAGMFTMEELGAIIRRAEAVVSVNTAIVHIAAAVNTPVVVLYAMTNPQHTPWGVPNRVLSFSVDESLKSNNEIIRFVDQKVYATYKPYPLPAEIAAALKEVTQPQARLSV